MTGLGKQEVTPLGRIEVLPYSEEKATKCVLQLWVKLSGYSSPILAVCDSGAEVALMSQRVYEQLIPELELRPTNEKIRVSMVQTTAR